MATRSFLISPELEQYVVEHSEPPDVLQRTLIEETAALGGVSMMQISPEQGAFMTMLVRLVGARNAVEVGTFTGYSSIAIARALPADGKLICCDVSDEWTAIAHRYWIEARVDSKIELRIAPALETLRALPPEPTIDFSFIDADKVSYAAYYEELVTRTRPGGLIACDNTLQSGNVIDATETSENVVAIRAFNDLVASDDRVDTVLLPVADGLTLLRRR